MNNTIENVSLFGKIKQFLKDGIITVLKIIIWPIMFMWKYIIIGVMYVMRAYLFTFGRVWHLVRGILVKYVIRYILFSLCCDSFKPFY